MTALREARCACGSLRLTAEGDPIGGGVCSCLACQRRTGSVISVNAAFPEARVRISGASRSFRRMGAESGMALTFHFCPTCGTSLWWDLPDVPGVIAVAAGCFADRDFPQPRGAIYFENRPRWLGFAEGTRDVVAR
jgi:hypothetical protein